MSFEVISFPQIVVSFSGLAAGAAPIAAGLGLAYGAYKLSEKLKADYQIALSEFKMRQAEAEHRQQEAHVMHAQAVAEATAQATAAGKEGVHTTEMFVAASLEEILRVATNPELAEIQAKAQELLDALYESKNAEELASEAVKLTAELHAAIGKLGATAGEPAVKQLFAVAKAEIDSIQVAEQRQPLLEQLARLEALNTEERGVAMQGLSNLRERSGKLIQSQINSEMEREQRRETTAHAVAMLQAIAKVPDAPEKDEAVLLLEQIGTAYNAAHAPSISTLEGFLAKSKALFEACENRLEYAAKAAYITDSVAETLMELGYHVSHVPAEGQEGCLVTVSEDTGMMVTVDKEGQLKTEMVAFTEQATSPDAEAQEHVCSLVDKVFEGLRKRDIQIKEKVRKSIKKDQRLKIVEKPEVETPVAAAKPKERAIN
jgi:hypothetical protein